MTEAIFLALGYQGEIFAASIVDEKGNGIDLSQCIDSEITFTRPDGLQIIKNLHDGVTHQNNEIQWINSGKSILQQRGPWAFRVAARFSESSYIVSYQSVLFWVV